MALSTHDKEIREIRATLAEIVKAQNRAQQKHAAELERITAERKKEENALKQWRHEFGSYTDTEAKCLEDEFYDALRAAGKIDGARLDEIHVRSAGGHDDIRGEYDLVAVNGKTVFVGEIKHNLTAKEVREFARNALPEFPRIFPVMAHKRKVRGMVGGARITEAAVKEARRLGFYILRLTNNRKLAVQSPEAKA